MSHSNPYRRPRPRGTIVSGTVKTLATTAVVAYGAYKAYQFLTDQDSSSNDANVEEQEPSSLLSVPRWLSSFWQSGDDDDNNDQNGNQQHSYPQPQQQPHSYSRRQPRPLSRAEIRHRHRLAQQSRQNCRHKVLEAYTKCWPAILQVIEDSTNTTAMTQELRTLRQQPPTTTTTTIQDSKSDSTSNTTTVNPRQRQDELWKQIQLETITKFVTTIYASSLLFLSLTMQLHWINGQVFQQQQQQQYSSTFSTTTTTTTTRDAQHLMVQAHQYMTDQGIPILLAAVRRAIASSSLEQCSPTTLVTRQDIDRALDQMETYLEHGTSTSHSRNWIRMVLPDPMLYQQQQQKEEECSERLHNGDDDDYVKNHDQDNAATGTVMLEAWWDLAESPAWQDAQLQTIHFIRHYLRDKGWSQAFPNGTTGIDQSNGHNASALAPVPVAKLMAPFQTSIGLVQGPGKLQTGPATNQANTLFRQVQSLATVLELGGVSFQE